MFFKRKKDILQEILFVKKLECYELKSSKNKFLYYLSNAFQFSLTGFQKTNYKGRHDPPSLSGIKQQLGTEYQHTARVSKDSKE